ncbi:MAG: putative Ig domain-containing protein [Acidobacteria bacterium]|nr:putative Ig domain-containing protein [Acidobacteriota bacterium]
MRRAQLTFIIVALLALCAPAAVAAMNYSFSGVSSDGRTVTFQLTTGSAITTATVFSAGQVTCAPACDSVGVFPNPQAGFDQVVVDVRNAGGLPTSHGFYFASGAFANPGNYSTINVGGSTSSGSLSVQTTGVPSITSPSLLPNGSVGLGFSTTFTAGGGTPPYVFSSDTALPAGLTLAPAGLLSGTPTTAGTYTLTIRVTDGANAYSVRVYTVSFAAGVNIATPILLGGSVGSAYSQTLQATGGTGIYTWSLANGTLPPGLNLAPNGVISGSPSAGGGYSFAVRATDTAAASATANYSITIGSVVTIASTSPLPSASAGAPYSNTLSAVGGTPPYTWSLASGTLPFGLTLAGNGTLSGTPTSSANYFFDLRVVDAVGASASASYQMFVGVGVTINTAQPPSATINKSYSYSMSAIGGTSPYTWSLIGGSLPPGLNLSSAGVIGGTPTTLGVYPATIRAADGASSANFSNISITVLPSVTITTSPSLPQGTPGVTYNTALAATGGAGPYSWTVVTGTLPGGLTLSTSGTLSGIPTTSGSYNFVARATDSTTAYSMQSFNITIGAALVITTPTQLPAGTVGVQYAQTLAATGGTAPYVWTIASGSVPTGLSLSASGALAGTPTTGGNYSFVVRVTDSAGLSTVQTFNLTVGTGLAITTPPQLPNAVPGVAYSQTLTAVGGTAPYTWSFVGGSIPGGLTLSTTGILSGTPTAAGSFSFQVRVTDATAANTTQTFNLNVGTGLTITTTSPLPSGVVNQAYNLTFSAAGGTLPYVWTLAGGTVPAGLSFSANGVLSGQPTTQGSFFFTVRVTDATSASVLQNYSLTVATGLAITTTSPLPNGSVGVAYSQTLQATGGVAPYIWSLTSGTFPAGLTIANNGAISGTPVQAGNYSFGVRVLDNTGASVNATFALTIGAGISITTPSLPNGAMGVAYSQTLAASGGTTPYIWSLSAGTLPPGLALANSGLLSGTPTVVGQYTFNIRVTDATAANSEKTFTITVNPGIAIITPSPLPNGAFGLVYFQTLLASGGVAPYTWSVSAGTLPPGLSLATNGTLSGTPTAGGVYNFTARVTDNVGTSATQNYQLTVSAGITINTTSPLPDASVGSNYSLTFGASGGSAPYTWTVFSGSLPPGLSLSTTGTLTGVPAVAGNFNFVVRLADAAQVSTQSTFSITVNSGNVYPRSGVISQIASGGGWKTTISLINPGTAQATVRVNLYADDGTPLQLPMVITQSGQSVTSVGAVVDRTIPAGATLLIETEAAVSSTSVGWADVRSTTTIAGYAIFRQKHDGAADSEGTSPLENRLQSSVIIPMDNLIGFSTGVALVNLASDTQATLTVIMRDDTGAEVARDTMTITANGHTSFSLPARFPILSGKRGTVEFVTSVPAGVTGLGLRFNPTLSFTSVPAIVR